MIQKSVHFYGRYPKADIPMDHELFRYLYHINQDRLRYIVVLISRLMRRIYVRDLTNKVTPT